MTKQQRESKLKKEAEEKRNAKILAYSSKHTLFIDGRSHCKSLYLQAYRKLGPNATAGEMQQEIKRILNEKK